MLADAVDSRADLADLRDQALMLAGMAVEVLLKAIAVSDPETRAIVTGPKKPRTNGAAKVWDAFYSHDLVDLAASAGITLDELLEPTATGLSQNVLWKDRYVLPREKGIEHLARRDLNPPVEQARMLIERVVREVEVRPYANAKVPA